jgi:hypothetical protein
MTEDECRPNTYDRDRRMTGRVLSAKQPTSYAIKILQ